MDCQFVAARAEMCCCWYADASLSMASLGVVQVCTGCREPHDRLDVCMHMRLCYSLNICCVRDLLCFLGSTSTPFHLQTGGPKRNEYGD
jgi:hypothetical protein